MPLATLAQISIIFRNAENFKFYFSQKPNFCEGKMRNLLKYSGIFYFGVGVLVGSSLTCFKRTSGLGFEP